jgi:hypothetical protein
MNRCPETSRSVCYSRVEPRGGAPASRSFLLFGFAVDVVVPAVLTTAAASAWDEGGAR